ncbi:MAG: hypothetical protein IT383_03965 [Deltaproteobacteria bacterium]|nr:hypothetical protein [Deltaproteobacteria bacterium]
MTLRTRSLIVAGVVVFGIIALYLSSTRCVGFWLRTGAIIDQCPDGETHVGLSIDAGGLRRGQKALVAAMPLVQYVTEGSIDVRTAPLDATGVIWSWWRVGKSEPEEVKDALTVDRKDLPGHIGHASWVTLRADLPDGDYLLRARATTKLGEATLDAPVPLYAPARIHVLTDRPLYEPGNTIKMRALVLRARDLVPLDGRPGRWSVRDPAGTVVLEERAPAGDFGVVEGELPLDASAPEGTWTVRYDSGGAFDEVSVTVEPFTLPRFTVSIEPLRSFFGRRDEPRVRVRVTSASGQPVRAALALTWRVDGDWPPPPAWTLALPAEARADASGQAELTLPRVPPDLMGKVALNLTATATDETGDQEVGTSAVLLAEDAIDVAAVTEFDGGLAEGLNNRVYLRVTTAAGAPLGGASVTVKRAWDKRDKGVVVDADEDGVAALQLDPGPAVNVLVPPMPVRMPPQSPAVERTSLADALGGGEVSLADITAVDRWNTVVSPCTRYADGETTANVTLRVEPSGRVARAIADRGDDASACVASTLSGRSVAAAASVRIFSLEYSLQSTSATLGVEESAGSLPPRLRRELERAARDARTCLGALTEDRVLPRMLVWDLVDGRFSLQFARDPQATESGELLDATRTACIEGRLARLEGTTLPPLVHREDDGYGDDGDEGQEAVQRSGIGAVRLSVGGVDVPGAPPKPEPTMMLGYELLVSARSGGEALGQTKLRLQPGAVPPLRLRPSTVVAEAGAELTIELLRGPDFSGELPKKLALSHTDQTLEADVDPEKRVARFALPGERTGWWEARFGGAVARVFVPRQSALQVAVASDKGSYRPGERAHLTISTRANDAGTKAAVTLVGVDETLATLTTLPGPDALERVLPTVQMQRRAFDALDATALALGRIRGKNAAAATVLLVSQVPTPDELDASVNSSASSSLDPLAPLADRFYTVLEALYGEVRAFEHEAPKDEKLTPKKMLGLWDRALAAAKAKGGTVTDAFGRPLSLAVLPDELVALTDPRVVVADGTRLPEDVEAWVPFVRRSAS